MLFVKKIALLIFLSAVLISCQSNSTETKNNTDSLQLTAAPRDSITSFEALFAPDQYLKFLNEYWLKECNDRWYQIAKAASRDLPCKCENILPTVDATSITIVLNNTNCFPPEMESAGYKLDHYITIPLEKLRPFLNETGRRIVFDPNSRLQAWLDERKKEATTDPESAYTLLMSVIADGKAFRIVLQSREGNNDERTISGYYEMSDGSKIAVIGYRMFGGFVVYDPKKDESQENNITFYWDDEIEAGSDAEAYYQVGKRYISGIAGDKTVYFEGVKIIGAYSLYDGPEEIRAPENGG